MQDQEEQPQLFTYRGRGDDTFMLPVSPAEFRQLPPERQQVLYDEAMATQNRWTDETIVAHPDWAWAAREIYRYSNPETSEAYRARAQALLSGPVGGGLRPGERANLRARMNRPNVDELSDEEVSEWLFDHIGELNGNLSGLVVAARDAQGNPQLARALNIAIQRYDNKSISFSGMGNVTEGVLQDPLTYFGVGGLVQGARTFMGQTVRQQLTQRLVGIMTSGAATGAVEGAAFVAADDAARQSIERSADEEQEFDWGRLATASAWGAGFGGALGFVLGDAVGLSRAGRQRLDDAASQAADIASTVADDAADVVDTPRIVPRVEGLDRYNPDLPQEPINLRGQIFEASTEMPDRAAEVGAELSRRLREIESEAVPDGTRFQDEVAYRGARAARLLRRAFTDQDPRVRREARRVVLDDMAADSPATRERAARTLVEDSRHRIERLDEDIRVEASRETPDRPLLDALELQRASEHQRFIEFEALSDEIGSASGRNLVSRQGDVNGIDWDAVSSENYLEMRLENARINMMSQAGEEAAETLSSSVMRSGPVVSSLIEWQRNALLSAPKTFIANITGPVINAAFEAVEELLGGIGTRFSGDIAETTLYRFQAMSQFLDQSYELGRRAVDEHRIVTGVDFIDGQDAVTRAISSENYGLDPTSFSGALVDGFGAGIRLPDAVQLFSDSFITSRLAVAEVVAQARKRARARGLVGDEAERFVRKAVDDTFDPNTGAIRNAELLEEVERVVARQRGQRGASLLERPTDFLINAGEALYRKAPATRLMVPFWRTPLRLLQQGARRMPVLQNFSQSFRRDLSGQNGYRAYARARGQFAMAQGIAGLVVIGTVTGNIQGEPHSFRDYRISADGRDLDATDSIGGFFYGNLDPVATPIRLISRITEEMIYVQHLNDEEKFKDLEDQMSAAMTGLLAVISAGTVEQTMLQGLEDTVEAFQIATDPDNPDSGGAMGRWFAQRATTFYPNLLKKVENLAINSETEQGRDFQSALIASTGLADTIRAMGAELPRVTTRRNILGEPVQQDAVLSAFGVVANERRDPVREELQRLMETTGVFLNPMAYRRNGMDLRSELTDNPTEDGHRTTIHDAWQANLQHVRLRETLEDVINSESYQTGTDGRRGYGGAGRRLEMVREVFTNSRALAWQITLQENPQFAMRFSDAQIEAEIRSLE